MDTIAGYASIGYAMLSGLGVGFVVMVFRSSYRRGNAA